MTNINQINARTILTGDRPTGKLHLGHYEGSLKNRLLLQENNDLFILIADTQVLNNDNSKSKNIKLNTLEVMKDYLAVGLSESKVNFFLQSEIKELFELTSLLSNFVTLPQVMRNPTIKNENLIYNKQLSMGFLNYPISQSADIMLFNADYIPVGEDQLPILEFCNDLIDKLNFQFNQPLFKNIKPLLSYNKKVIGIDGQNKMSKSLNNAIFLSDSDIEIEQKIMSMYTDPNHIKITDPGKVDGNVVFMFLDIFHSNKIELEELKSKYTIGGLGDVFLKKLLIKDIKEILNPIREKRLTIKNEDALELLNESTKKVKLIAEQNLLKIKEIIFS